MYTYTTCYTRNRRYTNCTKRRLYTYILLLRNVAKPIRQDERLLGSPGLRGIIERCRVRGQTQSKTAIWMLVFKHMKTDLAKKENYIYNLQYRCTRNEKKNAYSALLMLPICTLCNYNSLSSKLHNEVQDSMHVAYFHY